MQDDLIDCRYCHTSVDKAPSAGIPSTETCLACHAQVWNKSPLLDQVRASWFAGQPIPWTRVHKLPDFVYFNHAIHVNKGVGCVECHGRVDQMAGHRAGPAAHHGLVPRLPPRPGAAPAPARRGSPTWRWEPPADRAALGAELAKAATTSTRG